MTYGEKNLLQEFNFHINISPTMRVNTHNFFCVAIEPFYILFRIVTYFAWGKTHWVIKHDKRLTKRTEQRKFLNFDRLGEDKMQTLTMVKGKVVSETDERGTLQNKIKKIFETWERKKFNSTGLWKRKTFFQNLNFTLKLVDSLFAVFNRCGNVLKVLTLKIHLNYASVCHKEAYNKHKWTPWNNLNLNRQRKGFNQWSCAEWT